MKCRTRQTTFTEVLDVRFPVHKVTATLKLLPCLCDAKMSTDKDAMASGHEFFSEREWDNDLSELDLTLRLLEVPIQDTICHF